MAEGNPIVFETGNCQIKSRLLHFMQITWKLFGLLYCVLVPSCAEIAHAQTYPDRPVRIVVAYPPSGPTDLIARLVAQRLSESMRQQFVIDNRGGANGIIGTEIVTRSQPDGHTLLFGTSSLASNGSLYRKLPYDAAKDLSPIALTANTPYFLVVNAALPLSSVKDLLAVAEPKRSPLMPELPTVAEAGLPGYQSSAWFGFFGPAGLTRELRTRIATEIAKVTQTSDLQDRMIALGAVPLSSTPEQFDAYFREEVARYTKLIKDADVTLDRLGMRGDQTDLGLTRRQS